MTLTPPAGPNQTGPKTPTTNVIAWDLPTRLFKWSLVICVVVAWATNKFATERPYLHKWNGYALLVLLTFRLLWGIVGGSTSRFTAFVTGPVTALRFFVAQVRGVSPSYLGHTPISGLMIIALMAALAGQATLGLFSADPDRLIVEGPLADTVPDSLIHRASELHRLGFKAILVLASLHIAANLLYALLMKKGYLVAMVTGRKPARPYVDFAEARPGSLGLAAVCLAIAVAIVFGAIIALGGRPFDGFNSE